MNEPFRRQAAALAAALLLSACGGGGDAAQPDRDSNEPAPPGATADPPGTPSPTASAAQPSATAWDLQSSGEGAALVFSASGPETGKPAIRLFCPAGGKRIVVNVPGFRPIGSEERLTFGSGGAAHALVADTRGDALRGGVSGTGAVPANLAALIGGPVSASYGAQGSGPYPAPPADLARAFASACREGAAGPTPTPSATGTSPCLTQDGKRLSVAPLRAVGTEPFWGARIEGRCVTYSHPDDQQGTRVWTRYTAGGGRSNWTGTLGGRPFVLTARPQAGCSDGMSDRRYPIAVALAVGGEQRSGCAEPR